MATPEDREALLLASVIAAVGLDTKTVGPCYALVAEKIPGGYRIYDDYSEETYPTIAATRRAIQAWPLPEANPDAWEEKAP